MADDGIKLSPTVLIVSIYFKGIWNVRPSINDHLYWIFDREFNPLLRWFAKLSSAGLTLYIGYHLH